MLHTIINKAKLILVPGPFRICSINVSHATKTKNTFMDTPPGAITDIPVCIDLPDFIENINFNNCCIAGRSVSRMVFGFRGDNSDYDIFLYGLRDINAYNTKLRELILHFAKYNPTILISNRCTRIKIENISIDIVQMCYPGVVNILDDFDLAPCMFAIIKTPGPCEVMQIVTNDVGLDCYNSGGCFRNRFQHFSARYVYRLNKYIGRGFTYIFDDMPLDIIYNIKDNYRSKYITFNMEDGFVDSRDDCMNEYYNSELNEVVESLKKILKSENVKVVGLNDQILYKRYYKHIKTITFPEMEKNELDRLKSIYQSNHASRIPEFVNWRVMSREYVTLFEHNHMTSEMFFRAIP